MDRRQSRCTILHVTCCHMYNMYMHNMHMLRGYMDMDMGQHGVDVQNCVMSCHTMIQQCSQNHTKLNKWGPMQGIMLQTNSESIPNCPNQANIPS